MASSSELKGNLSRSSPLIVMFCVNCPDTCTFPVFKADVSDWACSIQVINKAIALTDKSLAGMLLKYFKHFLSATFYVVYSGFYLVRHRKSNTSIANNCSPY